MGFTVNTPNTPDAATLDFWRAAETGELSEVEVTLPRVADIDARNEHGVTALMRAAQHGHARMVRWLLAHGADANVARNDKFTALSLAAFFGHTEVVRALMEHGADSKASTRHATSAHMWATARTFNEVVDQLKEPLPPRIEDDPVTKAAAPVAPVSAATAKAAGPVTSAIVRTLKDPPEIWDLVHEEPPGFNARSAFVARLQSMKLTLRMATATVLIGACIVGVLVLRGVQARNELAAEPQLEAPTAAVNVENENRIVKPSALATETRPEPQPQPAGFAPIEQQVVTNDSGTMHTRRRNSHSRVLRSPAVERDSRQTAAPDSVQIVAASPEKSEVKVRPDSPPQSKSGSTLSPQLITPAKDISPKKKVIQWP